MIVIDLEKAYRMVQRFDLMSFRQKGASRGYIDIIEGMHEGW